MKYLKISKMDGSEKEISKAEAKKLLKGSYKNIDSMLKLEQTIPLMFCYIEVRKG